MLRAHNFTGRITLLIVHPVTTRLKYTLIITNGEDSQYFQWIFP